jgi:hypothetical protein
MRQWQCGVRTWRKELTLPIYEAELLPEDYRMKVPLTKDAIDGPRAFV